MSRQIALSDSWFFVDELVFITVYQGAHIFLSVLDTVSISLGGKGHWRILLIYNPKSALQWLGYFSTLPYSAIYLILIGDHSNSALSANAG